MEKFFPYNLYSHRPHINAYTYYDYLVVVDFEATCDDNRNNGEALRPIRNEMPEIIQFPAILIDVRQMAMVDYFDSIVKPVERPELSEFCTSLTGITQSMVDKGAIFPKVLRKFERWLKKHGLSNSGNGRTFALVTDGSYDMGHFLYKQAIISNLPFPSYAHRWVNLRTLFSQFYGQRWFSLKSVLEIIGQPFEGRPHNGLDDAKNIAKVLLRLLHDGCVVSQTEKILLDTVEQEKNEIRILNDKKASRYDLATVKSIAGRECIYLLPPNILYRHPPETDSCDSHPTETENKENLPSKTSKKCPNDRRGHTRNKKKTAKSECSQGSSLKVAERLDLISVPDEE